MNQQQVKAAVMNVSSGMNGYIAGIEKFIGIVLGRKIPVRPGPHACTDGSTIFLPPQDLTEEGKLIYLGKALHETSHILISTDFAAFKKIQLTKHGRLKAKLINATDDIRVEHGLQKVYPRVVHTTAPYWQWKEVNVLKDLDKYKSVGRGMDYLTMVMNTMLLFIARCRFAQLGLSLSYKSTGVVADVYKKYLADLEPEAHAMVDYKDSEALALKLYDRIKDLIRDDLKPPPPSAPQPQDNSDDEEQDDPQPDQGGGEEDNDDSSDKPGDDDSDPDQSNGTGDEDGDDSDPEGSESNEDAGDSAESEASQDSDEPSSGSEGDDDSESDPGSEGDAGAESGDSGDTQGPEEEESPQEGGGEAGEDETPEDEELEDKIDQALEGLDDDADKIQTADGLVTQRLDSNPAIENQDYYKDPRVTDRIGPGYMGSQYEGEFYKREGIELLGTQGKEMIRHFISQTKPRIIRRQDGGRFDATTFLKDRFRTDVFNEKMSGTLEKAALAIALDNSGSMDGDRAVTASKLLSGLLYLADKNGIPTLAAGYTDANTYYGSYSGGRTYPVRIDVIKTFEERFDNLAMRRCVPLPEGYRGYTPDLDCVQWITPQLWARPEGKKILFIICDGEPNAQLNELDDRLKSSYKKYLDACKLAGIKVFGFGIDSDLSPYFGEDWACVSSRSLASTFMAKLKSVLNSK
jgi:hypothetical protein